MITMIMVLFLYIRYMNIKRMIKFYEKNKQKNEKIKHKIVKNILIKENNVRCIKKI